MSCLPSAHYGVAHRICGLRDLKRANISIFSLLEYLFQNYFGRVATATMDETFVKLIYFNKLFVAPVAKQWKLSFAEAIDGLPGTGYSRNMGRKA